MWTPEDPIKTLWECLCKVQCISIVGSNPLTDGTIKDLTLIMFETTSMFTTACDTWRVKPVANQTLIEFCQHFTDENKEHLHKLMAAQLRYHGTNLAVRLTHHNLIDTQIEHSANAAIGTQPSPLPTPMLQNPNTLTAHVVTDNGVHMMFYCWTHGLGFNCMHTSVMCTNPTDGHSNTATATNMQGGKNIVNPGPWLPSLHSSQDVRMREADCTGTCP